VLSEDASDCRDQGAIRPDSKPPEATYMILTAVAITEIEAGFVNARRVYLKHRGLAVFNSDTVCLIGDMQPPSSSTPWVSRTQSLRFGTWFRVLNDEGRLIDKG
jgi:hypothetical protein